jgi:hypothetical protein
MPYKDPIAAKEFQRRRAINRHHLTEEGRDRLLAEQQGGCAICGCPVPEPVIDHNKKCCPGIYSCGKCIRGLLCRQCNAGLGMFKDSLELFEKVIRYLSR